MRHSTARLLNFRISTRWQKSKNETKGPSAPRAARIVAIGPSPTFLIAAKPNRIPSAATEKSFSLSFTSGGNTRIPSSRHSLIYRTTLSVFPISLVSKAAMNSWG